MQSTVGNTIDFDGRFDFARGFVLVASCQVLPCTRSDPLAVGRSGEIPAPEVVCLDLADRLLLVGVPPKDLTVIARRDVLVVVNPRNATCVTLMFTNFCGLPFGRIDAVNSVKATRQKYVTCRIDISAERGGG